MRCTLGKPSSVSGDRPQLVLLARAAMAALALLVSQETVQAQTALPQDPYGFSIRVWGVDDGLPQSTPTRMAVDERGFLWGGTFGGVFRFDGASFRAFDLNLLPGLQTNQLTAVAPSQLGGFWVAGVTGDILRVMDGEAVTHIPRPETQIEETSVLIETDDGILWNWAFNEIYAHVDGEWVQVATEIQRLWPGAPLVEVEPGVLWGGTTEGFFRITLDGLVPLQEPPFDYGNRVFGVLKDREGLVWAGLDDGVVAMVGEQRIPMPGITGSVENLLQAPDGSIWVTGEEGVWRIQGTGLTQPGPLDLASLRVTPVPWDGPRPISLQATPDGVVFVGALGGGLTAITPRIGRMFSLVEAWDPSARPDFGNPAVHSVQADGRGRLWVTQDCGPLLRIDRMPEGDGREMPDVDLRIPGCFRALSLGPDGSLWAAENTVLLHISDTDTVTRIPLGTIVRPGPGILEVSPRTLVPLGGDLVLVGTTDGILSMVHRDGRIESVPDWGLPMPGGIHSGLQTDEGTLWIGGTGEVRTRTLEGEWVTLTSEDGVPPGPVRVLHPDPEGGIWIGSYGGGVVYRDPSGRTTPLALQDPTISALLPIEDGSFWIPQNSGIAVVDPTTLDQVRAGDAESIGFRRLRAVDGIAEVNNGRPAGTRDTSGRLIIGTVQGLLLVDPPLLPPTASSPYIRVDRLRTPLREESVLSGRISLGQEERLLELDLSYPAFRASDPVRVRYRMVGPGGRDDWVLTSSPRVIQFASLNPGALRLELETSKAGGEWVTGHVLDLRVAPYLWERRAFQLLVLAVFLTMVTVTAMSRVRAQKAEAMALRVRIQREADQAAIAEQQRREMLMVGRQVMAGELSASLTHEVSQPISAITQMVKALRWEWDRKALNPDLLGETLDDLLEQSTRARDIIQGFRRFLAEGHPKGEVVPVRSIADRIPVLLGHDLREAGVSLTLELPQTDLVVRGERVLLQQVLLILVSNAIEAVVGLPEDRRRIKVRIRWHGSGGFRASVMDAGEGIPRSRRSTLFDPFQSTKAGGMGMGLSIARRIVLAHGGQISIRSYEARGTVASFWIPPDQQKAKGGGV